MTAMPQTEKHTYMLIMFLVPCFRSSIFIFYTNRANPLVFIPGVTYTFSTDT